MPAKKPNKPSRPNLRDRERYRRFVEAYLNISNQETYLKADRSAVKAGYSKSYAFHRGYELLGRVGVQDEMKRIREARLKSSTIATPEEILEALTQQLRVTPDELADKETGELIPLHKMSRYQAQAISGIKVKRRTYESDGDPVTEDTIEYKLTDRLKAAEMLARHHGIFERDNRQKSPEPGAQRLVAFPLSELTLEEWQRQVVAIMAGSKQVQNYPALPESPDSTSTS